MALLKYLEAVTVVQDLQISLVNVKDGISFRVIPISNKNKVLDNR